jgi:hypothetical protein
LRRVLPTTPTLVRRLDFVQDRRFHKFASAAIVLHAGCSAPQTNVKPWLPEAHLYKLHRLLESFASGI